MWKRLLGAAVVGLGLWAPVWAAVPPVQCVANVVAGGTADALTTITLPCALTTNLLLLTNTAGPNATSAPTLQPLGLTAQVIETTEGGALAPGDLGPVGTVVLLTPTGSVWKLLNPQVTIAGANSCDTLEAHGGGTGAPGTANATAWAAITNGCLSVGLGTYNFTGNATTTVASNKHVSVHGQGQTATTLVWAGSGGIVPALTDSSSSIDITDLSLQTSFANNPNGIGFTIVTGSGAPVFSNIDRVSFTGTGSGYWGNLVNTNGVTSINLDSDSFYGDGTHGVGLLCQGTGTGDYSEAVNVSKSNFWNLGIAAEMGDYCQSLTLTSVNGVGGVIGVIVPQTAVGTLSNLVLTSVDISLQSSFGVIVQTTGSSGPLDVQITNSFFAGAAGSEAVNLGGSFGTFTGNDIECNASSVAGLVVSGVDYMVTGNAIRGCPLGINLSGSNNNVQSNLYSGNTTNTAGGGARGNVVGGGSP